MAKNKNSSSNNYRSHKIFVSPKLLVSQDDQIEEKSWAHYFLLYNELGLFYNIGNLEIGKIRAVLFMIVKFLSTILPVYFLDFNTQFISFGLSVI